MQDVVGRAVRTAIGYGAFPVTVAASVGFVHLAWTAGARDGFVLVTGTVLLAGVAILLMQRIHPAVEAWRNWGDEAVVDLLHMVLSTGGGGEGARALLFGALYAAAAALNSVIGWSFWPHEWAWWAQLTLAALISELGGYWVHRLSHTWTPLWRYHALHHSSERLHTFSSGRNHPLHSALTYAISMAPLILMGAPDVTIALLSVLTGVVGLLQHANIAFVHGPLNYVFSTADLHRWHHSADMHEAQTNYGNNVVLFDLLFGTWMLPQDRPLPASVGLGADSNFPTDYLGQLASPWTWKG